MPDVTTTVQTYIDSFNEDDEARRRALVAATWTDDGTYVDPLMEGRGHDGIGTMLAGVRQAYPGHRFRLAAGPDAHHDVVRFTWQLLGPQDDAPLATGVDFGVLGDDGRLRAVTGFLESSAVVSGG